MPRNCAQFVYKSLLGQIESHCLIPDTRLPPEAVLAKNFSVSRMTVRKALAQLEAEGLIYCRPGVGSFVKLRVIQAAPNNRIKIGIAGAESGFNDWPYFRTQVYEYIRQSCSLYNCEPFFLTDEEFFAGKTADAFFAPMLKVEEFALAEQLAKQKPLLLLNRITDHQRLSFVGVDYVESTARVIRRMLLNGAQKIVYVGGGVMNTGTYYPHYMREQGYRQGHARAGVALTEKLILPFDVNYRQIVECLIKEQPDVIFISGALLVLNTITAVEVALPRLKKKLALFCFDDMQDFSSPDGIPVSCGKMPLAAMCQRAIKHLAACVRNENEPATIHEIFPMSYYITDYPFLI